MFDVVQTIKQNLPNERISQVTDETWDLFRELDFGGTHGIDFDHLLERYKGPSLDKTELCQRCSNLHFEDQFAQETLEDLNNGMVRPSHFIADMAVMNSCCALCQFLQRLIPEQYHYIWCERPEGIREEITFSSTLVSPGPESVDHSSPRHASKWLQFSIRRDLPTKATKSNQNWPKGSEMVNLTALKAKIEICKTEHKTICGVRKTQPVSGLLLINCETLKREVATVDTKYVALSYVWGSAKQRKYLEGESLNGQLLPRTIRDAASVTLQLGFKHLWVDQVCINQNGYHKMEQIRQMHRIYRNSEITIIAAAGDHSDYGIPGSLGTPRLPQMCFRIGDLLFVEKNVNPDLRIKQTPWILRGWTLQEEVMSKRTIVFTNQEAWFSCAGVAPIMGREFADHENHPHMASSSIFRKEEAANNLFLSPCALPSSRGLGFNSSRMFTDLVETYSNRDLTVKDDVINAFSGILGMFEQSNPPVHQFWGSPILPPYRQSIRKQNRRATKPQNPSLEGFRRGLCFYGRTHTPLVRRSGFPSWSWTGWIGPVNFNYPHIGDVGRYLDTGISIGVECADGAILSWAEFEELAYLKRNPELRSRFIHIQAWTMTVKLEYDKSISFRGSHIFHVISIASWKLYIPVKLAGREYQDIETQEPVLLNGRNYTAILMNSIDQLMEQKRAYFILIEMKTDHAERVGYIPSLDWKRYRCDSNNGLSDREAFNLQWKEIRLG